MNAESIVTDQRYVVPPQARMGQVHLKVSGLNGALDFYCDLLGFELMQMYGESGCLISADGYHHHIGLNTWYRKGTSIVIKFQIYDSAAAAN